MSIHLLFIPFHLLALVVLIVGEARAYRSHRNIWRAVGIPLGFVLVPLLASLGLRLFGLPRLGILLREFVNLGWPLVGLVWGTLQILREPAPGVALRSREAEPVSGSASQEAVRMTASPAEPASLKVLRVLLFAGGLVGIMACVLGLVLLLITNYAFGGLKTSDLWLWVAWVVNFFSYSWVVFRRWRAGRLLAAGIVVHAHLVYWVQKMHETADALPFVGVLLLGLLTYSLYTWLVWRQDELASRASSDPL